MKFENQYIIHFKGLKEGVHAFDFVLNKVFFSEFESLEIPEGEVAVHTELDRKTAFLDLETNFKGNVRVQCDRCLDYFDLPLRHKAHLVVRFSEQEEEGDDELLFLQPDEGRLNLKHYFYECISVSLPYRKVHPDLPDGEPGCDREMLNRLKDHLIVE